MDDDPNARTIAGIDLRHVLTMVLLDSGRSMTVAELGAALERDRFEVRGRTSKTISDALRWEIRKGRVMRAGRSRYRSGRMPRSTEWWMRNRVDDVRARVVAPTLAKPAER